MYPVCWLGNLQLGSWWPDECFSRVADLSLSWTQIIFHSAKKCEKNMKKSINPSRWNIDQVTNRQSYVVIHFLHDEDQLLESLLSLESHFWSVPEAKNAVQPNSYSKGRGISFWIFSDQFDRIPIAGWPSAGKKRVAMHISNLAAPATGGSTFTRLKNDEKHT